MRKYDVILTGAETHQTLVVMRSLYKRGIRMLVTGHRPGSLGFYSRFKHGRAMVSSPETQKDAFVGEVLDLARQNDIPFIFPVTETSLIALDEDRTRVDQVARLLAPPSETIRYGVDKKLTMSIAQQQNVPISPTLYPETIDQALSFADEHRYPVIFKPQGRSNDARIKGHFDFKVHYCHDSLSLKQFLGQFTDGVYPMMQAYAYGPHTQFMCFVERGEIVHSCFQDHMVRMLPMTGGIGARRLSCEIVPEIEKWSSDLFRAMNWEGCAQTQWKGPDEQGRYTFLEVSVRIIASIGSVVFSGVDHPWMHYQYFTGQPVERANGHRVNKHSRWFRGDAITVARHVVGDMPRSADRLPSRTRTFFSWMLDLIRPGLTNDVERLSDPLPGLIELRDLIVDIARILKTRLAVKFPVLRTFKRRIAGVTHRESPQDV